jgi:hypothetical protein
MEPDLLRAFGDGLLKLAGDAGHKRVVLKTPSVQNINHTSYLFPCAKIVILVRDCRAVVESAVRSFGGSYEHWTRMWAYAVHLIRQFQAQSDASLKKQFTIVRYEDLVVDCRNQMTKLLQFLDLDPARYDYHAAETLPVRGSSSHRGGNPKLHWQPVQKTEDFKPLDRFKNWTPAQHSIVRWIAGEEMHDFGYETNGARWSPYYTVVNLLRDVRWRILNKFGFALGRPIPRGASAKKA